MNRYLYVILFVFLLKASYSQTGLDLSMKSISNPTPEASKLMNYFYVPVNTSTGNVSISIPIYELVEDGVSVPINLSYHTGGIRVTDISGSVGLGWSINAGGGIYRSINGLPDDSASGHPSTFLKPAVDLYDYSENGSYNPNSSYYAHTIMESLNTAQYDMNQDDYTYNFLNKSGSLFFNFAKTFVEGVNSNTTFKYNNKGLGTITAIDKDGITYIFSDKETTATTHTTAPMGYPPSATVSGTTAWKISTIQTLNGKNIAFGYVNYSTDINYQSGNSMSLKSRTTIGTTCFDQENPTLSASSTRIISNAKLISTITTDNVLITFYYSDHLSASNWKKKLDKVEVKNNRTNEILKIIEFSYSLFSGDPRLRLDSVKYKDSNSSIINQYGFGYRSAPLPTIQSLGKDIFGFYNGANNSTLLKVPPGIYYVGESSYNSERSVHSTNILVGTLEQIVYPTGGKTLLYYDPNVSDDAVRYAPGIRIKKVEQYDPNANLVNTKTYEYFELTGRSTTFPSYALRRSPIVHPDLFYSGTTWGYSSEYTVVLSELPKNFFYGKVITKEKGSNGNDAIIVDFYQDPSDDGDHFGSMLNNGYYNPLLYRKEYYKNSFIPINKVKELKYQYSIHNNSNNESIVYKLEPAVLANWVFGGNSYNCFNMYLKGLEEMYKLRSNWITTDWEEDIDYTEAGTVTKRTEYVYNNPLHYFPSKIKILDSKGETTIINRSYTQDFIIGTNPTDDIPKGIKVLQQKNIISPIIEQYVQKSNTLGVIRTVSAILNTFKSTKPFLDKAYSVNFQTPVNNFSPLIVTSSLTQKDSRYELRNLYSIYNESTGNILELQKVDNVKQSYIWGYNDQHAIASVINSAVKDIFHTSFEEGDGNSTDGDSKTGKKSKTGGYTKALTNLTAGTYILSYWQKSGSSWTYVESKVTVTGTTYNINVPAIQLDELRFYPSGARMTTYTYEPLVGMTSQCDVNNRITYYEYDSFGRLTIIRDQDRNVIRTMDYQYQKPYNQ